MTKVIETNLNNKYVVDSRRLAKNAVYLYARTFVIMLVTLYTSRTVLQVLGESDYGVYNVVGGITLMFTFVTAALTSATQRFLNYEIGKGNKKTVTDVFCMSMNIFVIFAVVVVVLGETIGIWFLNTKLNIPEDRMTAARFVYQFSILTSIITLIRIPYNASIIAYEKMSFYAYISIAEALLKLGMVYVLLTSDIDSLILYSILLVVVALIIFFGYFIYSVKKFDTCKYELYWDEKTSKQLLSFSSWSILGSIAHLAANQGVCFVLNIFCGVVINAALGIANQVFIAVISFVSGFQTAFNPQLVKSYASGNRGDFYQLIYRSSRLSFFLMLIPAIPLFFWCKEILHLWLTNVPDFTVEFTQMTILYGMIDSLSNPLWTSIQATGKVKFYQSWVSIVILLNLPIAYVLLNMGFSPVLVLISKVFINVCLYLGRLFHLSALTGLSLIRYLKEVSIKLVFVFGLSLIYPVVSNNHSCYVMQIIISIIVSSLIVCFFGLSKQERIFLKCAIKAKLKKQ